MLRPEEGSGEGLAGQRVDLRALHGQLLPPLAAVGLHLVFGENGPQQNLLGGLQRLAEVAAERTEADVDEVAVEARLEVGAVEVELFGDLAAGHARAPLGEQVGRRAGDERRTLGDRPGVEYEADADHLEVVGPQGVEFQSVPERQSLGAGHLQRGGDADVGSFHRAARYIRVELFSGRKVRRQKSAAVSAMIDR